MKIKLITLTTLGALSLGSFAFAQEPTTGARDQQGGRGSYHNRLQRMTEQLNLTPEQKVKVQPIVDQATPQIENIRREAMQKTKALMDNAMAQIRPLLTPEQQKRLDDAQNDRRGKRGGHGGRGQGQRDQDDSDNG
jgi:Spy/CpxP family protein refolding chaperone